MARANLFEELDRMRHELDGLLGSFDSEPFTRFAWGPRGSRQSFPLVNVSDEGESIRVEALAPGLDPQSIQVTVTGNQLVLAGNRPGADESHRAFHRRERNAGQFKRTLDLNIPVDSGGVSASYSEGILRVSLPKHENARPRRVDVNVD